MNSFNICNLGLNQVLKKPLKNFKGVGEVNHKKLIKLRLEFLEDLIFYFPVNYQDNTRCFFADEILSSFTPEIDVKKLQTQGIIASVIKKNNGLLSVRIQDEKSNLIEFVFFKLLPFQINQMKIGKVIRGIGKIKIFNQIIQVQQPQYIIANRLEDLPPLPDYLTPVYPSTENIYQKFWLALTDEMLKKISCLDLLAVNMMEIFIEKDNQVSDFKRSFFDNIYQIHRPKIQNKPQNQSVNEFIDNLINKQTSMQKNLIFEELFSRIIYLKKYRYNNLTDNLITIENHDFDKEILSKLPFKLTKDQHKSWLEIKQDLLSPNESMQRLLQGDVGSGKTIIAILAAYLVAKSNYQVAFMNPTEILARQNYVKIKEVMGDGIKVLLLTSSLKIKEKQTISKKILENDKLIIVGTHSLFQNKIIFKNLGLVVIDEQHKFGVEQRLALINKINQTQNNIDVPNKKNVNLLLMTATPIPRTLSMVFYGDLKISTIKELPANRKKIITTLINEDKKEILYDKLHKYVLKGNQAYYVCPLIDDSEKLSIQSVSNTYEFFYKNFPDLKIAAIHGKTNPEDKEKIMQDFQDNKINILIATTVIEVGVNVPNASLIIIENSERLGLSQLHQLRGRVGRGEKESYCILLYSNIITEKAKQRLKIIRDNTDGFKISEEDLKIRGSGDIFNTNQIGGINFYLADLARDKIILEKAYKLSLKINFAELINNQKIDNNSRLKLEVIDNLINRWIKIKNDYLKS